METLTIRLARPAVGQVQLVDVGDLLVSPEHQAAAQRLQEGLGEDLVEGPAEHLGREAPVERLHRPVPAATRPSRSSTRIPESMLSRMFSLYSVSRCSSSAFSCRLLVEAPVHEGGGRLAGERLQQVHLLAVEGIEALLAAHPEHGDQLALDAAGEVVREVQGPASGTLRPGLDVDGLAACQAREERPAAGRRTVSGPARAPAATEDREDAVGAAGGTPPSTRRPGRPDALEQPLADAAEVEVGVQVLRQAQQGACASRSAPGRTAGRSRPGSCSSPG